MQLCRSRAWACGLRREPSTEVRSQNTVEGTRAVIRLGILCLTRISVYPTSILLYEAPEKRIREKRLLGMNTCPVASFSKVLE